MVTEITLGTLGTQNGRNVLTGGATKLDTKALVDSLTAAKRLPAVRLETANKKIDEQSKALNELKTLFSKLQTASDTLRSPPGVGVDSKNIFQYRTAALTSSTGAATSNYVEVAVQPGATAQSYTIDSVTQLALQTKQQSGTFAVANSTTASAVTANGSPSAGFFRAGTVNLRAVDGTVAGIPVTLNEGDSLDAVAAKFNEVSSRTGIQASVLTIASGSYKIVFTATKPGTTYGFNLGTTLPTSGAGVASDASGVLSQLTFATTQTAQNAVFSIDGVSLTRETNSVADVLTGVTFTLKQSGIPGTIGVEVKPDTDLVANAITQFADAYNEFRLFAAKQTELGDDGKPKETALLYNNTSFRTIVDSVSNQVTSVVSGISGSNPSRLIDIGIKLENFAGDDKNLATKNILVVDSDKLKSTLLSNFSGVRALFEYQQTSNNSNFLNTQRSNNLTITSFSLTIDRVLNIYQATYTDPLTNVVTTADFDANTISTGGIGLKGKSGTIFDGTEFVYAAAGDATISVSLTQGFGDKFYNLATNVLDNDAGLVTIELDTLTETKTRNTDLITALDEQIARYRDQLLRQYANLESAISRANNLLNLLDAQANARNNIG